MADQAPSRAVVHAVAPEVALVESTKRTSEAAVYTTVVLGEKKAMVNSTVWPTAPQGGHGGAPPKEQAGGLGGPTVDDVAAAV